MDEKKFDKSQLKTLCRGNRTDRGWEADAEGRWTPSLHDRRRLVSATVGMIAEGQGGQVLGLQAQAAVKVHARAGDPADFNALAARFAQWLNTPRG